MIKAVWKRDSGGYFKELNAQDCYEELEIIKSNNAKGEIPNQEVVDYARNHPTSELYKAFNWNDFEAAEAFRRHTANNLKNCLCTFEIETPQVRITNENDVPQEIPLFINPSSKKVKNHVPTEIAMSKPDLRKATLEKALRQLQAFQRKYHFLKELDVVFQAISKVNIP